MGEGDTLDPLWKKKIFSMKILDKGGGGLKISPNKTPKAASIKSRKISQNSQ